MGIGSYAAIALFALTGLTAEERVPERCEVKLQVINVNTSDRDPHQREILLKVMGEYYLALVDITRIGSKYVRYFATAKPATSANLKCSAFESLVDDLAEGVTFGKIE